MQPLVDMQSMPLKINAFIILKLWNTVTENARTILSFNKVQLFIHVLTK